MVWSPSSTKSRFATTSSSSVLPEGPGLKLSVQ